jgi:hypothetical protein
LNWGQNKNMNLFPAEALQAPRVRVWEMECFAKKGNR